MKKLIYAFIMMLFPLSLMAQQIITNENFWSKSDDYNLLMPKSGTLPVLDPKASPADEVLASKKIDQVIDAYFSMYGRTTPIVYEPISGTLVIVQHKRESVNSQLVASVYLMTSTNNGTLWSMPRQLFTKTAAAAVWPSLGVVNIDGTKNPNNLIYLVYSVYAEQEGSTYPWKGGLFTFASSGELFSENEAGPGPTGYSWWQNVAGSYSGNDEGFIYHVGGVLESATRNFADLYGISGKYVDATGYESTISSGMPAKWNHTVFRKADPGFISQVPPLIETDDDGAVYVATNGVFVKDPEVRTVGFCKSTNYGQAWSDWETIPFSLITDFAANEGSVTNINFFGPATMSFSGDALIVNGPDDISYIYRILTSTDGQQYTGAHIVEARYRNNVWSLTKVSDFEAFPMNLVIQDVSDTETPKDSLQLSRMACELQAAKTADGKHIIVKWVDPVDKVITINPPFVYSTSEGNMSVDELYTNDVFMSYRSVDGGAWSQAKNVTNDDLYNKLTFIPQIVPDINNVPMIELKSIQITNTQHYRYGYHDMIKQMCIDPAYPQDVMFSVINITGAVSVENDDYQGAIRVNEVMPNPSVNEIAEFSFYLDKQYQTRIEVFNSLGQKVLVAQEGILDAGMKAININTSKFAPGIYYITLSADGQAFTKIMSVTK